MKGILFNSEMVRAILEDRKTVTRRVVKPKPLWRKPPIQQKGHLEYWANWDDERIYKSPYRPGDILYVRETFHKTPNGQYWYKADNLCTGCTEDGFCEPKGVKFHETCKICEYYNGYQNIKWRPSIHMPRETARIFLRVTNVRVERLQGMTIEDSLREGVKLSAKGCVAGEPPLTPFALVWDRTIKKVERSLYGWDADPWVWVIEFERCEKPEGE